MKIKIKWTPNSFIATVPGAPPGYGTNTQEAIGNLLLNMPHIFGCTVVEYDNDDNTNQWRESTGVNKIIAQGSTFGIGRLRV